MPWDGVSMMFKATIKWFDIDKGYGFAILDNSPVEIFFHISSFVERPRHLYQGTRIAFALYETDKGYEGKEIRVI